ncbi:MAG: DUF503 domain-containing protein [Anaerolineales bacterium]|nr:MAG: DUF503 domain-containing protein [Anaerolineales bacterium]
MHIGTLTVELHLPGCNSLKQKRSLLKPLLSRLHREFNISAAEIDQHDHHRSAFIACAIVSNDVKHIQRVLEKIPDWIENHRPDLQVVDQQFTLL